MNKRDILEQAIIDLKNDIRDYLVDVVVGPTELSRWAHELDRICYDLLEDALNEAMDVGYWSSV